MLDIAWPRDKLTSIEDINDQRIYCLHINTVENERSGVTSKLEVFFYNKQRKAAKLCDIAALPPC